MATTVELSRLEEVIRPYPSALVALSGGVDSSVVAAVAQRCLGERALAVTLRGPSLPRRDLDMSLRVTSLIGIRHQEVTVDQLLSPEYAANPTDRCYFCRSMEGGALVNLARELQIPVVLDGVHADDLREVRPGLRAMNEWGMKHPLLEANIGKEGVRRLARALGLPNSETPSNSCLASRVAQGHVITRETLSRIDAAEEYLGTLGFERVRVRLQGEEARVQVGEGEVSRLQAPRTWGLVRERLISLGFTSVTMDPVGYRVNPSGSL